MPTITKKAENLKMSSKKKPKARGIPEADSSFQQDENQFPPVRERLGYVRPSQELLEYYRCKIAEYDNEYENLMEKLEKYKNTYEHLHKGHWEIRQREDEIRELQKALSDMQIFLFQERDHVLRLYAENDRLKIKELDDRKKIQHLLSLTQPVSAETTYFIKEPPAKVTIHQRKTDSSRERGPGGHRQQEKHKTSDDVESLESQETMLLTVEALKAQLEEQSRLCKDQVDALLEDRRVRMEESQAIHDRDTSRIQNLSDQLHTTQSMLYDSTKDYLDLKYEFRSCERTWMADKDELLSKLDQYREKLDMSEGVDPLLGKMITQDTGVRSHSAAAPSFKDLQFHLRQSQQISDNYREQCINMEQELCQLREQAEASKDIFHQRSEKIAKRLKLMNKRYEALEARRKLEVEGYKTDIKLLRQRLKEVEKQLYKLTLTLSGDQDMQILNYVKKTSENSKKLMGDLQNLKAKIYSLENDARHIHEH